MKSNASNPFFAAINKYPSRPFTTSLIAAGLTLTAMLPGKLEAVVLLTGTTYSENFNSIGTSGTASLPTGWKMTAAGDSSVSWDDGANVTATTQAASSGAPATGGRYNWGNGSDTSDRAIGFMTSGGYASPNSAILGLTNNTGSSISAFTLAFDYERYRINTAAAAITFFVSSNGSDWTAVTAGDSGAFSTGASAYNFTSGTVINKTGISVSDLSIANGSNYYFRWNFNTTGGNSQGLGLDNFSLTATLATGTAYFWLGSDTTRGGSGTWTNTGGSAWSTTDADGTGTAWDSTKTATFNTAAASVTVDGTVDANNGINFATGSNGSTITGGTALNLGGATIAVNTITTASGVTATIGTNLTGATGMTKAGAGTLVLTGDKTYTGGTTISGGILQLGNGTNHGSVLGAITNNASLAVNNEASQTLSNNISGSGTFTKLGSGNLTLSGTNSYSGGTTVSAGTLTGTTASLQGAITNNAAVVFDQSSSGTYAGNMSGSGSLSKLGDGNLTLSGANAYSGGTTVTGGTLTGTSTSLQGAITNNSAVVFDQGSNGTYAGNMTGSGSLTKQGNGNLTLSGTNAYSGGTTVNTGTLTGTTNSLQGDITNNASVVFDQATNGTYAGTLTGTGTLTKTGTGSVTLSGNNSHQGGTIITGGTLVAASNTALGSGAVEVSGASLLASAGTTVGNAITVEAVTGPSQVVAYWNFNALSITTTSAPGSGGVPLTIAANQGSGTLSLANWTGLVDDFGGTTLNSLSGDPAEESLSLIGNAGNGSYLQISGLNLTGLKDTQISFATRGTDSGFNSGQWSYSTDGTAFTNFGTNTATTSTIFAIASVTTTGLDHSSNGSLRYTLDGATNASGNNRIDNLQITATSLILPTLGGNHTSGTATFSGDITLDSSVQLTSANGGTVVFSGTIADGANGAQGITKVGAGTVELTGANTFTGDTQVIAGTLMVNNLTGSATGSGDVSIASGASLVGGGTISGAVTVDGIIAPGNSIGTLSTGSLTWNGVISAAAATNWQFELGAFDASDLLSITGDFMKNTTGGGLFQFDFLDSTAEGTFELVTWTDTTNFVASDFSYTGYAAANPGQFSIVGNSLYFTTIPEPGTALVSLLAGLGLLRRRRSA